METQDEKGRCDETNGVDEGPEREFVRDAVANLFLLLGELEDCHSLRAAGLVLHCIEREASDRLIRCFRLQSYALK
jgi:hypothetical protein